MTATSSTPLLLPLAGLIAAGGLAARWVATHPRAVLAAIDALLRWPWMVATAAALRRLMRHLLERLRPAGALGVSIGGGLAALLTFVWLFGAVLHDVLGHEDLALFDAPVVDYVIHHRAAWLTSMMQGVTLLGGAPVISALVVVGGLAFRRATGSWRGLALLASAALGALALELIVKSVVARPRPAAAWQLVPIPGWAFPSAHAAQAAVYGGLAYLAAGLLRSWRAKVRVWGLAALIAFGIGVSRVYLVAHWPSDVLAGWALAGAWLALLLTAATTVASLERGGAPALPPAATPRAVAAGAGETALQAAPPRAWRDLALTGPDGLDLEQVRAAAARGEVNRTREAVSRTIWSIVRENVFTRFNALLGSLLVVGLWVGPLQDALFGVSIALNTVIGIAQELRAKWALDRLALLSSPRSRVVREGAVRELPAGEIVLGDLVELRPGDQVPVDGPVVAAEWLEVDESLLSGESHPVSRGAGDVLLSGSFVVAGRGRLQAAGIGASAYARRLAAEGRKFALAPSELRAGTGFILSLVSWLLVPTGVLLVSRQLLRAEAGWRDAVSGSIAALVGMVPQGLVLLTSAALAIGAVRLGRRQVVVQDLGAVEVLARADVLCLDKTGTLTDGEIAFDALVPLAPNAAAAPSAGHLRRALGALSRAETDPNPSLAAIGRAFPGPVDGGWRITGRVPFSSGRRWAGIMTAGQGSWILGAPEVVLGGAATPEHAGTRAAHQQVAELSAQGPRVLALGHAAALPGGEQLPADLAPVALVTLTERVRPEAEAILLGLAAEGMTVKIISGDDPRTVAAVARRAGIAPPDGALHGARLPDDPAALSDVAELGSLFGRVAPHQKREIIAALRRRGHVVAMIGDGVNDVLALKEADLGIAVRSAVPAARAVAQAVLLDGFESLPHLLAEGRRLIANVERTANLFIAKTWYVVLLALAVAIAGTPFPLLPRQVTLVAALTVGVPAFFLALAPNGGQARTGFLQRVLRFAVPAGCVGAAAALASYAATRVFSGGGLRLGRSAATLTLAAYGLALLAMLPGPRRMPVRLAAAMGLLLGGLLAAAAARSLFALELPGPAVWLYIGTAALGGAALLSWIQLRWEAAVSTGAARGAESPGNERR